MDQELIDYAKQLAMTPTKRLVEIYRQAKQAGDAQKLEIAKKELDRRNRNAN